METRGRNVHSITHENNHFRRKSQTGRLCVVNSESLQNFMDSRTVREEQDSQRSPAGVSGVRTEPGSHMTAVLADLLTQRREKEDLDAKTQERKQVLESLQQRIHEMQTKVEEVEKLVLGVNIFIKNEHINQVVGKAEREREEGLEKEAEIERLKEQHAQLMERKQELQHQAQRHALYGDFMERVVKMTKFEEVQSFMVHLENLLHLRDQLCQKEREAQEEVDQLRKALQTLEDQHHLLWLHTNNQLSQLHNELDNMCSEALTWESKWNHILETAAKKTLLLVKIKMVTLNLYELTDDKVEGEEGVDMNDTEKQLDKVKMFIQDHSLARAQLWTEKNRAEKGRGKKHQHHNSLEERLSSRASLKLDSLN